MRSRSSISSLRWISIFLILASVILLTLQLVRFSRMRAIFPPGMIIAGVPVGGLDRQGTAQELLEVYTRPVELRYAGAVIHLDPAVAGFELDLESMLAAADLERSRQPFWTDFWNFLLGRPTKAASIPLRASFSEVRLRSYLQGEVVPRYDKPPMPAQPAVGTVKFQPGIQGTELDISRSIQSIDRALKSPTNRSAELTLERTQPERPSIHNLEILLRQTIYDVSGFDGTAGVYLLDLQTAQEIHFLLQQGQVVPNQPDLAFTAASIIKIPIMVSVFRRYGGSEDPETIKLLEEMIELSGNDPADWVMERVIDENRAPLEITADMRALGLDSTFLSGQFYTGAPLLGTFETPGNSRTDISTDPDIYSQTTVSDMGMLLADIYQCQQNGGGALMAVFPGEFTQGECQLMVDFLAKNDLGSLIEGGVPEGTRVAHKHGWTTYFGVMNSLGDAGIVYTPGGNYILVVFLYHPNQLLWEPASDLVGDISEAVYNYYNIPSE